MLRRLAKLLGIEWQDEDKRNLPAGQPANSPAPLADVQPNNRDQPPPPQPLHDGPCRARQTVPLHRIPLNKLGLFGPAWRQRLTARGIRTAAQFVEVSSEQWQQWGMSDAEIRQLRRWEKAVRLASSMPSMKPYEAMMLFAIHRRRLSRLAGELPGRLHRDLLRFALSSRGKKLLRSRAVPDRQRVAAWIEAARDATARLPAATP